jgi:hypothetical protein
MILNETNLKLKFESIFADDPNFESESQNTKDWAFRAFVAAHGDDLGIYFVRTMNERLFKDFGEDIDLTFYPSFELVYGVNCIIIKFGGVVVWDEDNDGMLCDEGVIDGIKEKVRKILAFLGEQKLEELFR